MAEVPIGAAVVPVFPYGADDALTLFNNGPGIVYIGNSTSLSAVTGFPLAQGSAIVWDANNPLYGICGPGSTASLYYVENSGPASLGTVGLFPGSTVALEPGATVGLASGTHVGLAAGSEVSLATGTEVALIAGTTVDLASPVSLAAGTEIDLASPVSLAAGSEVTLGGPVSLASGSEVTLAAPISLASGSEVTLGGPVSLATGTEIALAAGTSVVLADGSTVSLASGTQVDLASPVTLATGTKVDLNSAVSLAAGSTVDLASPVSLATGSVVDLASPVALASGTAVDLASPVSLATGTAVNLATGAKVDLATGATVGLESGSSVAVSSLPPNTSQYWPCTAQDTNPPTLSNAGYVVKGGTSGIAGTTTNVNNYALWNTLNRYSGLGTARPLVLTFLYYFSTGVTNNVGFGNNTVYNSVFACDGSGVCTAQLNNNSSPLVITLSAGAANTWVDVELVFTRTMTRLTVNKDSSLRVTGVAIPDGSMPKAFGYYGAAGSAISGLFASYPDTVPA